MASCVKVGQEKPSNLQEVVPAEAKEWLRAIYELGEFNAKSFRGNWLRDGSGYMVLEPVAGENEREIVSYDVTSGKRTVLTSLSQLVPPGATGPLAIGSYTFSPDGSWLLLQASMSGVEGRVSGTWILERNSGKLRKAGAGRFISISPDGQRILYSEQGNFFAYDIHNSKTIALTKNAGGGSVSNSRAVWSPDGKQIAFVESDASDVRGNEIRWLSIPEPAEGLYIEEVSWAGNSHEILVEKLSRFRDEREFLIADVRSGEVTYIYHESDPAWVLASYRTNAGLEWIDDGRAFVLLSEKDGWRHAFIFSRDGEEQALLTPGDFDIIGRGMVDEAGGWFYYFASSRKYPVFVYVYSEPHGQTVEDRWSTRNIYHCMIADLGYLIVSIDSRGTPAPKGAAWRRAVFPSLGPLSTEEQASGLQELGRTRQYVDLSRVGIWGWSGGGSNTLNAMFRKPDIYHVGIAVAPKPQPHLYNAWFQEIYIRTREENPEGYRQSAPINFAEGLKGDLLIIHGTGETNTHLEITEGLVDRLIELGKSFDYMTYPNRNHGIRAGEGTSLHLHMLMTRFLLTHLPPGAR